MATTKRKGNRQQKRRKGASSKPLTCDTCDGELVEDPAGALGNCLDGGGPVLSCPRGCMPYASAEGLEPEHA